jgi:hypothetical protein
MKNRIILLLSVLFVILGCSKSKYKNPENSIQESKNYNAEFNKEVQQYLMHAKTCNTEYEVKAFQDSLPIFKRDAIQEFGSEANWHNYLNWLKVHGAKTVKFTKQGIPVFSRTEKSPWGH